MVFVTARRDGNVASIIPHAHAHPRTVLILQYEVLEEFPARREHDGEGEGDVDEQQEFDDCGEPRRLEIIHDHVLDAIAPEKESDASNADVHDGRPEERRIHRKHKLVGLLHRLFYRQDE